MHYCPICGNPLGRARLPCCTPAGLVKRRGNAACAPFIVAARSGRFQLSQRRLGNLWPAGLNQARQMGNRVLYPEDIVGRPFLSNDERDSCNLAIDWLKCRAVGWPSVSRSGYVQTSIFDDRLDDLRNAYRSGDPYILVIALEDFMEFFESISMFYCYGQGKGIGRDMVIEVIEMGKDAAPLVAAIPDLMYALTQYMWKMTSFNDAMIHAMVNEITLQDQSDLLPVARNEVLNGTDVFPQKLLSALTGYPDYMIRSQVFNEHI